MICFGKRKKKTFVDFPIARYLLSEMINSIPSFLADDRLNKSFKSLRVLYACDEPKLPCFPLSTLIFVK